MPRDAGDGNSPSADDYDLLVETTLDKPSLLELAAYHEAGHAVAAIALKIKFDYIIVSVFQYTAPPNSHLGGFVFDENRPDCLPDFDPDNPVHRETAENWAVVALAGEASESIRGGAAL